MHNKNKRNQFWVLQFPDFPARRQNIIRKPRVFWALNETKRASCASYQNNKINEISSNKRLCVRDYQWKLSHELREKLKYEEKSTVLLVECSPILYCLHQIYKKSIPIFHSLTQNPFCSKSGKEMRFQLTCHCSGTTLCLCDHHNQ